ncbi:MULTISPECIES: Do family serine endopeptidase [Methylobacterium]|uniref:Probable periplasmic serine endoprotease DegP-like n=3 Tax=Pseudomonadota TaxID=1224 RepID=A0ABQ4SVM8_9HYPH|nr:MULTISPECIES: Do family serine endopeptidase [Methylobacterium]PIU07658.1 MAG: serine peptidase [Methylobacterium sp. CG09_land_8_20_14_0_10_71_15]PIU11346.1 MAG: serine peptidase [Methylobacterium sp. CG08_land_8_20_14_0_20_71_15]GBU20094.1 serine endoprotease [Methylobacterium sp.]GJE05751.1 Periplasmic serine endoprotease DegP [Methylobacterium jeotgali]
MQTEPSRSAARRFDRKAMASVAAAALVAGGALGAGFVQPSTPALAQALPKTPIEAPEHPPGSFANIVDKVKPGVVSVKVKLDDSAGDDEDGPGRGQNLQNVPPQLREFFRRFGEGGPQSFGNGAPQRREGRGAVGSGFIISGDGYVVTNNHVVDHASTVQVTLDDGRTLDAKVIGKDSKTDIALLKIKDEGSYPYVQFGRSAPRVGDWVVAIGNPFGLGGTVTAGIVSARGRDIGAGPYDDFLQIDAPINKGNSGGPTFNVNGEVVGVNTAIASPSGGSVGLAFAIPAETVQAVVDQLRTDGKVARGYLGVQIQPVTKDIAEGLGLPKAKGALVDHAEDGTPAAKAGLKSGDVIESVNGAAVNDARELSRRIAGLKPGSKIEVAYLRGGKSETATVTLGSLPTDTRVADRGSDSSGFGGGQTRLGLGLAPASEVGLSDEGVAVVDVDPDGPAAAKGIARGDVILDVGGSSVSKPSDVAERVRSAETSGRKAVLMRVKSAKGGTRFVAVALGKNAG